MVIFKGSCWDVGRTTLNSVASHLFRPHDQPNASPSWAREFVGSNVNDSLASTSGRTSCCVKLAAKITVWTQSDNKYVRLRFRGWVVQTFLPACNLYRGADKSLALPGRKQATATEVFEFHISWRISYFVQSQNTSCVLWLYKIGYSSRTCILTTQGGWLTLRFHKSYL